MYLRILHETSYPSMAHTGIVADHGPIAAILSTVTKDAEIDALEGSEGNAAYDGGREGGQQQQHEGGEE